MFSTLKNHPFAVEAFFEQSVVLTFAFPKEQIAHLIPKALNLDTYKDKWAFIAVAIVKTKSLRPKGFPRFLGNDFVLVGYRVFVKYVTNAGKRLRGLYIIKSETDKKIMQVMGNIFTHYDYTTTDIKINREDIRLDVISTLSHLSIELDLEADEVSLPINSPFVNWKEARRYAGPLPFTFNYNSATKEMLIVEGVRESWTPKAVNVIKYNLPFLNTLSLTKGLLANAFIIENIPYYWKKGKIEIWNQ